jgi:hypothetical protein
MVVMLAVFLPNGEDDTSPVLLSMETSIPAIQSAAAVRYLAATTQRYSDDGGRTTVDLSKAYQDAKTIIPIHTPARVVTENGLVTSINSPTRAYGANAFFVNVSLLLEGQFADLIAFEQKTLGVTGHRPADEYALEQSQTRYSITGYYGDRADVGLVAAVGPAVTMRNYYQDLLKVDFWKCFSNDRDSAYCDAMLVKQESVEAYFNGEDVNVTYVQVKIVDAKAHAMPWGIAQTYIQRHTEKTMLANWNSSGARTPDSAEYMDVLVTGDAPKDLAAVLTSAKNYPLKDDAQIYWWPTVRATAAQLGVTTGATLQNPPYGTANVFECGKNEAYTTFAQNYQDYTLVGILVYATN